MEDAIAELTTTGMRLPPALSNTLTVLIAETIRLRAALRWYANEQNYIDGAPLGVDEDGHQSIPDEGIRARMALRLHDVPGPLIIDLERTERAHYEARLKRLIEFSKEETS